MRKNMKWIGLAVCLIGCAGIAHAQEANGPSERQQHEKRLPREVPNPEKTATRMTDEMKQSLGLTDKQYKKIYKLNLKEQKALFKAMQNPGGQRPPMGGGPMGGGPEMGGGRPPMGGGQPPMMGEGGFPGRMGVPMMDRDSKSADSIKKAAEAKEKKFKKILTEEQYAKWQDGQKAAREKAFQRRMPKDKRPDKAPDMKQNTL